MGLRFTVLSSGSTGNATVVTNGEVTLMIDAGFSARRIDELLTGAGNDRSGTKWDSSNA